MKILISGASGFVGTQLTKSLTEQGHQVYKLSRKRTDPQTILWNIKTQELASSELENFDSVVHLAGENIFGFWTENKKRRIYESRIAGTKLLVDRLLQTKNPPKSFLSTSATGYYGSNPESAVIETDPPGNDFLSKVCIDWEASCLPLLTAGVRVVQLRFGIVISPQGGMLKKMTLPFKLGVGTWLGNGQQSMPWISLNDLIEIIKFSFTNQQISGPVNAVAPEIISNKYFSKQLAKTLRRPCLLGIPRIIIKMIAGQELSAMLLADQKVIPKKLSASGFDFHNPNLEQYFESIRKL